MKKWILLLVLLLVPLCASAELSTNLNIRETKLKGNKRLVESKTYYDAEGNIAVPADKGYATVKYTYGSYNVVIREEYLDENGELTNCTGGYAYIARKYREKKLLETAYYDVSHTLVPGPEGYARQVVTYEGGHQVSTWNYDPAGDPVGIHRILEYIKRGKSYLVSSDTWYDTENRPAAGPNGYARVEYEYNGKEKSKISYIGEDGSPYFYKKEGYATKESLYSKDRIRSTHYYGKDNEPIAGPDGYAYCLYTHWEHYTTEMYYNADGTLFFNDKGVCGVCKKPGKRKQVLDEYYYVGEGVRGISSDGYGRVKRTYDMVGKITNESYYDENDQPMTVQSLGYAKVKNIYVSNHLVRTEYYGADGKPVRCSAGYAYIRYTVENMLTVEEAYFDTDGKTQVNGFEGYARVTYEHEAKNITSQKYYNAEGEAFCIDTYDELRFTWDGDKKASESYWRDGAPVYGPDGCHEIRYEYNNAGKESRQSYFDTDGVPVPCSRGYAVMEKEYDSTGRIMSTRYYDPYGQLVRTPGKEYAYAKTIPFKDYMNIAGADETEEDSGEADEEDEGGEDGGEEGNGSMSGEFDETDDGVIVEYHGTDGRLMMTAAGYAYIVREKNRDGLIASEKYYDTEGRPVLNDSGYAQVKREYNDRGLQTAESYFDAEGEPMLNGSGYHRYEREYPDPVPYIEKIEGAATVTADTYYDTELKRKACNAGYDQILRVYNENSKAIRMEHFLNGERTTLPKGYSIIERAYDETGLVAEESYFGESGEPVLCTGGYHRIVRVWQDPSHATSEAWFDTEDKPMAMNNNTYSRVEREYDAAGNPVRELYYDASGKPVACKEGYNEVRRVYNDQNKAISTELYLDGKRTTSPKGYSILKRVYDETGLVAEESYFGEHEEPVISAAGCHRIVRTWQDPDHATSETWFDTEGMPVEMNDNTYVRVEREFDEAGNTIRETYFGADGKAAACREGYDEIRRTFNEQKKAIRTELYLNGERTTHPKGYSILVRAYDENGLVAEESYFGVNEEPVTGSGGYHRIVRVWQDPDHATSEAWFDTDDQPMEMNGNTYVRIERVFDEAGNPSVERYYGADGKPAAVRDGYDEIRRTYNEQKKAVRTELYLNGERTTHPKGYSILVRDYDENGLVSEESYFGVNEEPVLCSGGYHRIARVWQDPDHATSEAWFDTDDQPMPMNGNTYVRVEREFDEAGNPAREMYFGADGKPAASNDGYDEIRRTYNENRKVIRMELFLDGKRTTHPKGYSILERAYDETGLVSEESYFGLNEEPVLCSGGYHRIARVWQDPDHATSEAWFDTDDKPMPMNGNTYVRVEREFDEAGNPVREQYFDAEGNPVACSDGYDEIRRTYNENHKIIRMELFLNGERTIHRKGYAILERVYDETGLVAEESNFGLNGEPVLCTAGYHRIARTWLDPDHATSEAWFDTDNIPMVINGNTYVRVEREFDEAGNPVCERYYGADGNPAACSDGYDEIRRTYNDKHKAVQTELYLNGERITHPKGYSILKRAYDETGLTAEESYFGTNEEPVLCSGGYHRIVRTWQDPDHATSEAWFDTDDKPMPMNGNTYVRMEREFDEAGNPVCERYYGPDGKPVPCSDGYDEIRRTYNENHKIIRMELYLNGERTIHPKGYSALERVYDETGLVAEESCFGVNDEPVLCTAGYHRIARAWQDPDHATSEAWFDTDGKPMGINGNTYVRVEREFDEAGNPVHETYYGTDDRPIACNDGYDEIRRTYNDSHKITRMELFLNGERTTHSKGYSILERVYDETGLVAEESCFGVNGEPMLCTAGYHRIVRTWQDPDHATSEAWFSTDGNPMGINGNTYVRVEREFDESGNPVREMYYGADGEPAACSDGYDEIRRTYNDRHKAIRTELYLKGERTTHPKGYSILERTYDETGLVSEESYFGINEEPVLCSGGYHRIARVWQDPDHATGEAWFDTDDKPMPMNGNTYVRVEREFDEAGNPVRERYYGADGEPAACSDGYDEIRRTYNDRHKAIRTELYLNGERTIHPKGYSILKRAYDETGLVSEESYFGINEEPVLCSSGYHRIARVWQDPDHATGEAWFDTDDKPMPMNGNTYVRVEREFDEAGNPVRERYYGADGESAVCSDGYDEIRRTYNDRHKAIRMELYLNGERTIHPKGYSILKRAYDETGLVSEESYFGINEEPVLCSSGYHRIARVWQDPDHATGEAWFDTDDQPMPMNGNTYVRVEREFDEAGNPVRELYFDEAGKPIATNDGYDEIRRTYNDYHKVIRMELYLNGDRTVHPKGYSALERVYDETGLVAEESCFGVNDDPVLCTAGYHRIVRTWLDPDHATSEAWFDTEGNPMGINGNTYVRVEREYDEAQNRIRERYFDADGNPAPCSGGFDEIRWTDGEEEYYLNGERYRPPENRDENEAA